VDINECLASFLQRVNRKVNPDFSDVKLNNKFYQVDPRLRGDAVEVRYDPFSDIETVQIYSLREEYLGQGVRHERKTAPSQTPQPQPTKLKYDYTKLLIRQHDEQLAAATKGIDYTKVVQTRTWPFNAFAAAFARLLGREGAIAAFTAGELESLKKIYNRSRAINEHKLKVNIQ